MRSNRAPPWAEVIRLAIDARLLDLHVAMPAKVDAYNAAKGTVDVVPLLQGQVVDAGGNATAIALPKIPNVPLMFPGGGGFRTTFPIAQGDTVLIIIADRSLDIWKATGQLADPKVGSHSIPDAIAIPGLRSPSSPLQSAPTDRATFGADGGPVLEATSSGLNLGAGASQGVGLGNALRSELNALWNALKTHLHGPGNTPAITGAATVAGVVVDKTILGGGLQVESGFAKVLS